MIRFVIRALVLLVLTLCASAQEVALSAQGVVVSGAGWSGVAVRQDAPSAVQLGMQSNATAAPRATNPLEAQTMVTRWTSGGFDCLVSTPRKANESAANQAKRHKEAVDAMLTVFPKETQSTAPCTNNAPPWFDFSIAWSADALCHNLWATQMPYEDATTFAQRCADAVAAMQA